MAASLGSAGRAQRGGKSSRRRHREDTGDDLDEVPRARRTSKNRTSMRAATWLRRNPGQYQ